MPRPSRLVTSSRPLAYLGTLAVAMGSPRTALAQTPDAPREAEAGDNVAPDEPLEKPHRFDLLTFHRPNFFLSSFARETPLKFQVSIKYDLWPNRGAHHVYASYTQLSLWRAYDFEDSSPFEETNYAPGLFYSHEHDHGDTPPTCRLSTERIGYLHTSNGRSGEASRSWDRVFAEARGACGHGVTGFAGLVAWLPFWTSQNPDIVDFVGYGRLTLGLRTPLGPVGSSDFIVKAQKGISRSFDHGNVVLRGAWHPPYAPGQRPVWRFLPFLYAELFLGYGQTLIQYDERISVFRVGIAVDDELKVAR